MKMEYRLAGVGANIPDQAVAAVGETLLSRDGVGGCYERVQHIAISCLRRGDIPDVGAGDDERMGWGARIDIAKGDHALVLINASAGNLARDDAAEKAGRVARSIIGHLRSPLAPSLMSE